MIKTAIDAILMILLIFVQVKSPDSFVNPQADYTSYTREEQISFFDENKTYLEQLVTSTFDNHVSKANVDPIENRIKKEMKVYFHDKDQYAVVYFTGAPHGFSNSGVYYSKEGVSMIPVSYTLTEYDAVNDKNVAYLGDKYAEVYQIDEHWFYFQKANYKDSAYRTRPAQ